jgi:hypothetical protein
MWFRAEHAEAVVSFGLVASPTSNPRPNVSIALIPRRHRLVRAQRADRRSNMPKPLWRLTRYEMLCVALFKTIFFERGSFATKFKITLLSATSRVQM